MTFILAFTLRHLDGPWDLLLKLHKFVGNTKDDDGDIISTENKFFAKLLACFWCICWWVSALVALVIVVIIEFPSTTMVVDWFIVYTASISIAAIINTYIWS